MQPRLAQQPGQDQVGVRVVAVHRRHRLVRGPACRIGRRAPVAPVTARPLAVAIAALWPTVAISAPPRMVAIAA
ncbi:hypothetical protein Pme01_39760 [Planosporangium mesophilum]|uniref:Uncharacterized protein n=1 Tax=Planosporangium mesophilum TaxID=689768 RepID=A0A8J3X2G6_9ACTN|nr:hypothetical protein Pme01_39760 [Planosporangium mesophilum]